MGNRLVEDSGSKPVVLRSVSSRRFGTTGTPVRRGGNPVCPPLKVTVSGLDSSVVVPSPEKTGIHSEPGVSQKRQPVGYLILVSDTEPVGQAGKAVVSDDELGPGSGRYSGPVTGTEPGSRLISLTRETSQPEQLRGSDLEVVDRGDPMGPVDHSMGHPQTNLIRMDGANGASPGR